MWYIGNDIPLDINHLNARQHQSCKWLEGNNISLAETIDHDQLIDLMRERIDYLDIESAKKDIRPFIKNASELDLWSKDFFLEIVKRLRIDQTNF